MAWRIGVDSGGTFTDICLFEDGSGNIAVWKVPSTPADPSRAVAEGVREALAQVRRASKRCLLFRARHDRGDQCADPASRRINRLDHQ
jgi:N-methylhydantoinase A/oxoprolinase/acetone carboxylase beta subunit